MWHAFLAWLASLAADPVALDREAPRAAAAVAAAYASLATDEAKPTPEPEPGPQPKPGDCCKECGGRGYIVHADGHRTACPCPSTCPCKKTLNRASCPDGKCPIPRASPASGAPARPAGGR
jgi:hypothetical protein